MADKIELKISANVSEAMKEVAGFRQEYAELVRQVEKPLRQIDSFRELEGTLEQTGRKMREARDRVRELGNALAAAAAPSQSLSAEYQRAVSDLQALERQEASQIGQLARLRAALQASGVDLRDLAAEQRRLAQAFSTGMEAGRADASLSAARSALGVGAIEQTQRQLVELRQQYRLVTSDSTLSAKQRAEAEANYRHSVEQTLTRLRELRQASAAPAGRAQPPASDAASSQAAARSALGVGTIEQTQRQLVELRQQYRLVTSDGTLSAKQRAEAEANYRSSVAATLVQLRALRAGLNDTGQAMQRGGLSAGQYQQALQQLPMQLTDVVTSLASGMPIWLVAIQQGGQIRDSFGGIGNAARAVVSSISPMTAGIGAAVVAGGALLALYQQGRGEAEAYARALIMSGNAAGTSADQLATMAQRMDEANGTQHQAAAALAEIAGTGKFTAEQIEAIGSAAVAMELTTGTAVADTVKEFAKLADEPSKASAELNKQYNYLTGAVYAQIRALEEQGRKEEAAKLATDTFASAMQERSREIEANTGTLGKALNALEKYWKEMWDAAYDIGRPATLEEQLEEVERDIQQKARSLFDLLGPSQEELAQRRTMLRLSIQQRDADAKRRADEVRVNQESIEAQEKLDAALEKTRSAAEKLQERYRKIDEWAQAAAKTGRAYTQQEIQRLREAAAQEFATESDKYQENLRRQIALHGDASEAAKLRYALEHGELGELTDAQKQGLIADAEALDARNAAAEAAKKAAETAKQQVRDAEQLARSQESYVAGLEKQAAALGLTTAQVRAYELAEKSLSGALSDRAKAALATLQAYEKQQQADRNAAANAGLRADYLRAAGQPLEAALLEIETRFAQLRKQFAKDGNEAGLALIDQLIPVEQARARLDGLQAEIDRAFDRQGRSEQSIDAQVNAGLLTESEGRARLLALHRQTADVIERYLPELERMAQLPGPMGEQAQASLDNVRNKVLELRSASSDLEIALRDGLQGGIQEALDGLADGTLNLRDAVMSLVASVADALAELAAQRLAEQATAGLMGLLGGGQGDSSRAAAITAASTVGAQTMGAAIVEAGVLAGAAMAQAITAAGNGQAVGGAVSGAAGAVGGEAGGLFSTIKSWFGFATGGHVTGPGTGTSDSIPAMLSNWEYVTRAAVVRQPGALDFLHAFNARGMAALDDYARRVRHATGGLAGVPAPALPAPSLGSTRLAEPAKALSTTVKNAVNLHVYDDPIRITQAAFNSRQGEQDFVAMLSKDPAKFRSVLGL